MTIIDPHNASVLPFESFETSDKRRSERPMTFKNILRLASCLSLASGIASAQNIDYGTFETLFGESVTASATGAPSKVADAAATMEIITSDDIRRSGETDLIGVLSRVSGINTQRFSRNAGDVAVRGYNSPFSPRLLVLVNGRQVYQDLFGYTMWDEIPVQLEEIRQIEVVKGPSSALFGFNAVAGVVNIITFNPIYDDRDTANIRVDQDGGVQGSLVYTEQFGDRVFVRGSIGGYTAENYDNVETSPAYFGSDPNRLAGSIDAKIKVHDRTYVTLEGTASQVDAYEQTPEPLAFADTTYESTSIRASIDNESRLGLFSATVYQNSTERGTFDSPGNMETPVEVDLTVGKVQMVAKPAPAHTLRVAGEMRTNDVANAFGSFDASYDVRSASLMWDWKAAKWLNTTLAGRVDDFDGSESLTEFSYNAAAVIKPSETTTIRLQSSRGLQIVSVVEQIFMDAAASFRPPNYDPTIVDNYSVDLQQDVAAIGGSVRASVFHQINNDVRQVILDPVTIVANGPWGDSELFGLELSAEGQFGDVDWDASYTYLDIDDDLDAATIVSSGGYLYEDATPESEAKLNVFYNKNGFSAGGALRYVSDYAYTNPFVLVQSGTIFTPMALQVPNTQEIDAFTALDLRVAYTYKDKWTFAVESQDLTNDEPQTFFGDIEPRVQFSLTLDY